MTDSSNTVVNIADELTLLEERRVALLRLIRIAQSLEALQQGLQTVADLKTSGVLPDAAVQTFEALGRKIRNLSDVEVKLRLQTLDQKVATKLKLVLGLADELNPDQAQSADGARLAVVNQLVDEFKKHAQTAVALRVLLAKRGIQAESLALSVPEQTIRQRLTLITSREHQCRGEVVRQVEVLQAEVQKILAGPGCKPALQAVLHAVLEALQANLDHLHAGKPVGTLPIPMADIAFDVTPFNGVSYAEPAPGPEPEPGPEAVPEPAQTLAPVSPSPAVAPTAAGPSVPPAPPPRPGFWRRFSDWINTPWHVGWKDLERKPVSKSEPKPEPKSKSKRKR